MADKTRKGFEEPAATYAARADEVSERLTIEVAPHHLAWARERVAAGEFESPEAAILWALNEQIPVDDGEDDWALPYIEEARRDLEAGRYKTLEEVQLKLRARIARLRAKASAQ